MFSSWKRKINKVGSKSFPEHHLSGGQGSSSHEVTNTTSCVDSDYCNTAVEAAELLALAKQYEKQLLSKHQQQESTIFDASNYIHVLSSLDDENIPVYRLALRRSKGLEDMFLSIVPDECCQMSEDDSSAMIQSLDEIAASALEVLYTCNTTLHPVNNCVTKAPPPLPPTIVNSLYELLTERNTNNSTPAVKHRPEDSLIHLHSTLMLPHSSSSTNEPAVRSILLRPNNNADPKKPKQLKRVQFTASSLEYGNVKNNKSSTSECSSTTGSADLNNSAREKPTSNENETNANHANTNNIRCVSTPLPTSYACPTYLNYKDSTDTHTELSNDSSGEDDSTITGALSTNGSNLSADPNNSERTIAFAPFCSLPTAIVTTGSGACTVLGVEKQLCALFSENKQQAAYINNARESLPGKISDLVENRSSTATAKVDLKLDGGGDGRRATKILYPEEHGGCDNRCSGTEVDFEFHADPQRYSLPTAKRKHFSDVAATPVSAYNSSLVRFSIEGDETFDDVRASDLGASTTNDSSVGSESYTTEDTATATGFAMESASYSCSSQDEDDDDATKNTEDESRDDSEFSWNASFPSKEFVNETDSSCGTTIMEYSDSSNDVSSGASARMLSLNLIERDAASAVDATGTKVVPSRFLDVGVVNQPPTASSKSDQIVAAATTKDYSWGMLSPKRLLSLNKNHRQPSIRDVVENTTIRPSADAGLDCKTSRKLSRSNSPCPKYLTKTIMKGGGANE